MDYTYKDRVETVCACGCGETFLATPKYRPRSEGGGLWISPYKRGHHPNCRKNQTDKKPAWNKGLKKGDHPSIERMGYQPGHQPYNNWDHVNEALRTDPELRKRWLESKKTQVAWNKGLTKDQYPNGIASGADHGNWKGGHRGVVDTSTWAQLRRDTYKRDNYTCQECGDRNHEGRGSRIRLEAHHIVAVSENPELALEPENVITLCHDCHVKTHNYGAKAIKQRRQIESYRTQ